MMRAIAVFCLRLGILAIVFYLLASWDLGRVL